MKRVLTALLLIPLVTAAIFYGPAPLVSVIMIAVVVVCLWEFYAIAEKLRMQPFRIVGYGAASILILAGELPLVFFVGLCALLLLLSLQRSRLLEHSLDSVAATVFGVIYIGGSFALGRMLYEWNPHWLFFALLLNWIGDSVAYYAGRALGRHKLAPRISPKKTWEGAVASALLAAPLGAAYLLYFEPIPLSAGQALAITLSVNIASQIGDLGESVLKRGADIKDSGNLLPGHGGMLDRLDGVLFTFPALYLCLIAIL